MVAVTRNVPGPIIELPVLPPLAVTLKLVFADLLLLTPLDLSVWPPWLRFGTVAFQRNVPLASV